MHFLPPNVARRGGLAQFLPDLIHHGPLGGSFALFPTPNMANSTILAPPRPEKEVIAQYLGLLTQKQTRRQHFGDPLGKQALENQCLGQQLSAPFPFLAPGGHLCHSLCENHARGGVRRIFWRPKIPHGHLCKLGKFWVQICPGGGLVRHNWVQFHFPGGPLHDF